MREPERTVRLPCWDTEGKKVGWKLAPSRIEAVQAMKVPWPGRAPIFAGNLFPSGATVPCGPKGSPANITVIEAECGFI